jgi:hypothetical protein
VDCFYNYETNLKKEQDEKDKEELEEIAEAGEEMMPEEPVEASKKQTGTAA